MIASGLALPARRITVNLAPADLPNASETALSGNPMTVNVWTIISAKSLKNREIKISYYCICGFQL
jgi:predicted ATPase with chaperone activity